MKLNLTSDFAKRNSVRQSVESMEMEIRRNASEERFAVTIPEKRKNWSFFYKFSNQHQHIWSLAKRFHFWLNDLRIIKNLKGKIPEILLVIVDEWTRADASTFHASCRSLTAWMIPSSLPRKQHRCQAELSTARDERPARSTKTCNWNSEILSSNQAYELTIWKSMFIIRFYTFGTFIK